MSGPGKGRYTDYVGDQSPGSGGKAYRLHKLFNNNPMTTDKGGGRGFFYGATVKNAQIYNDKAAASIVEKYVDTLAGDFPNTVFTDDGDSFIYFTNAPDTKNINVKTANIKGSPANQYIPDLTAPGARSDGQVNFERPFDLVNEILVSDIIKFDKPYLIVSPETLDDKFTLGTVSPHISSIKVGIASLGSELIMGSSLKK